MCERCPFTFWRIFTIFDITILFTYVYYIFTSTCQSQYVTYLCLLLNLDQLLSGVLPGSSSLRHSFFHDWPKFFRGGEKMEAESGGRVRPHSHGPSPKQNRSSTRGSGRQVRPNKLIRISMNHPSWMYSPYSMGKTLHDFKRPYKISYCAHDFT